MRELTVLYDATCALCKSARVWLEQEPRYIPIEFLPAASRRARQRFPQLDAAETLRDITVVDDEGHVYRGAKAWVICLWTTRRYRSWSATLADPDLWPLAKRLIAWVSRNRGSLGSLGSFVLRKV